MAGDRDLGQFIVKRNLSRRLSNRRAEDPQALYTISINLSAYLE